jgi:hypothetical protein
MGTVAFSMGLNTVKLTARHHVLPLKDHDSYVCFYTMVRNLNYELRDE